MTIELKPEQEQVIERAIQSGIYRNQDEAIEQAFEFIRAQLDSEDWMIEQRETLAMHIATGFAQAEGGELMDGEEAVKLLRQRRAERNKMAE